MKDLLYQVWKRWHQRDALGHSAAVSFYAIFAFAPLILFSVSVLSHEKSEEDAKHSAASWLSDMIPQENADSLLGFVQLDSLEHPTVLATITAGLLFLWSGSLIFTRLVFGTRFLMGDRVDKQRVTFRGSVLRRLLGLSIAMLAGLLVCGVIAITSFTAASGESIGIALFSIVGIVNSLLLAGGSILLIRFVPENHPSFRVLLPVGSILFLTIFLGRLAFQSSLSEGALASSYGAASAIFVILMWIFFLSIVHFLAAVVVRELSPDPVGN